MERKTQNYLLRNNVIVYLHKFKKSTENVTKFF